MALILNIETTTTNCSVSLSKKGETLVLKEDYNTNFSHAERLHVYIDAVLKRERVKAKNLDAIAISKGPGSFTGLRIGVSAAKGLCFALDKPLISISTLEALAYQVTVSDSFIITMLDARRMEVYSAVFDSNHNQIRGTEAQIIEPYSFNNYLGKQKVHFIGDGVEKTKNIIKHPNALFTDGILPSAEQMGLLAYNKYKKNDFEDVTFFEPYYLKDFVALKSKKK